MTESLAALPPPRGTEIRESISMHIWLAAHLRVYPPKHRATAQNGEHHQLLRENRQPFRAAALPPPKRLGGTM